MNNKSQTRSKKNNPKGAGWNEHFENYEMILEKYINYEDIINELKYVINSFLYFLLELEL